MRNRVFIIGDPHIGHRRIIQFAAAHRPFATIEEHDDEFVRRWNVTVDKQDTVWVLGDVIFGSGNFRRLGEMHGIKRLVMGNHDNYPAARYLEYFNSLHGSAEIRKCILTHFPVHPAQFHRYRANIHAHTHHRIIDDPRYICVSAEQFGLTPVLLDTVMLRVGVEP